MSEKDKTDAFSYTVSLSYDTPIGLSPYVTISEQVTVIASQMADIDPGQIADGVAVSSSELTEVGVKGSFLNDQLFFQANYYEQERLNVNTQDVVWDSKPHARLVASKPYSIPALCCHDSRLICGAN